MGLRSMLTSYTSRVVLLDPRAALERPTTVDVVLYEPARQTPTSQAMLRDLVRGSGAVAAIYSWRDPDGDSVRGSFAIHLSKAMPVSDLVASVEALRDGGEVASLRRIPADPGPLSVIDQTVDGAHDLTPREAEILSLVTQGLTNSEIGARLYLSINSVKTYIRAAYRKIDVTRRAQAVAWGMEHGLAPLAEIRGPEAAPGDASPDASAAVAEARRHAVEALGQEPVAEQAGSL
ncbi:helix-turn-helix transcriptional regulator [Nocardioides bruguierae]|uniref:helix-turn-helix transcriptional regulator n=1 Tax=Nocardioides bruguierae TaxID=2945102 RepID=UPI0020223D32|nr:response regulator transcription factor [Nocardioides bruguierae]MCL8026203.1 response regulator transcription factor [Nocardioides bruguierae]